MPAARSFATRALVALVALSAVALVCAQATAPSRPVKPTCSFAKPDASKCEAWKAKLDVMVPALCKNRAEKVETDLEERIHAARSAYFFRKAEAVTQYEREILDPSTEKLAAMKRDAKLKEFRAKRDQRTKTAKAWAKVRGKQAADECENQKKFLRLQLELNCTPKVCKERSCPWATAMRQHARDVCRFEREQARANRTQALNTVRADYRARLADLRETEGKIRAQHTSTEGVVTYLSDAGKLAMKNVRAQRADARRTRAKKEREVRIAYRAAKRASRVRCKARRAKAQKRFAFVCTAVTPQPTDAQRLIRQQARAAFKAALKAKANSNKLAKQARDLKRATAKSVEKAKPTTAAAAAAAAVKAANAKERIRRATQRRQAAKAAAVPALPAATAAPTVKA